MKNRIASAVCRFMVDEDGKSTIESAVTLALGVAACLQVLSLFKH